MADDTDDDFNDGMIFSLLTELRGILDQYPDDNQILKELIQNAEDAGATEIKFLHDKSQYSADTLHHPGLEEYQGPALYAYNDAKFSDRDWKSIRMTQESLKKDDPMTVGQFGLGFKSVFHVTDLPGILSGDRIAFLDPHEYFFEKKESSGNTRRTSSFSWKLNAAGSNSIPANQLEPFCHFGMTENETDFNGTIFRFPLRKSKINSKLSSNLYDDTKIQTLFAMFQYEAHSVMLFLNHIEKIEFYEKCTRRGAPKLLFSVRLSDRCVEKVRSARSRFHEKVVASQQNETNNEAFHETYQMETVCKNVDEDTDTEERHYLVTQYYDGGKCSSLATRTNDDKVKRLPWTGIALPLDVQNDQDPQGQIFCFLPLPATEGSATGFHFHVHGYFAVERNRRNLKWPSADHKVACHKDADIDWNGKMVADVLPKVLKVTVLYAISKGYPEAEIYRLFPDGSSVQRDWIALVAPFYTAIQSERVYFTTENQGQWLSSSEAFFLETSLKYEDLISKLLLTSTQRSNLVCMPKHVLSNIPGPAQRRKITPAIVSSFLSNRKANHFTANERAQFLEYFSEDQDDIQHLKEIPFCQLQNDSFVKFNTSCYLATGRCATQMTLILPGLKSKFHKHVNPDLMKILETIAESGETNLEIKGQKDIPKLLREMFAGQEYNRIAINNDIYFGAIQFQVSQVWFNTVWKHIQQYEDHRTFTCYERLPLIQSGQQLYSLNKDLPFLMKDYNSKQATVDILRKVGFVIIENANQLLQSYIPILDANSVVQSIAKIPDFVARVECLTATEKRKLRDFLSRTKLNHDNQHLLQAIPILETFQTIDARQRRFVSHNEAMWGGRTAARWGKRTAPCVLLPREPRIIDMTTDTAFRFCQITNVTAINDQQLLKDVLLPNYSTYGNQDRVKITQHIIKTYRDDNSLTTDIRQLDCIPTTKGLPQKALLSSATHFTTPQSVVDPTSSLACLFDQQDGVFPLALRTETPFEQVKWKNVLQLLGMRDTVLKPEEVLEKAKTIATLGKPASHSLKRCKCLYQVLLNIVNNIQPMTDDILQQLKEVAFLPKLTKPKDWIYPWAGDQYDAYLSFNDICETVDYGLVGSVFPIADSKIFALTKDIKDYVHLQRIEISHIAAQVGCVVDSFNRSTCTLDSIQQAEHALRRCYQWCEANVNSISRELREKFYRNPLLRYMMEENFISYPLANAF